MNLKSLDEEPQVPEEPEVQLESEKLWPVKLNRVPRATLPTGMKTPAVNP